MAWMLCALGDLATLRPEPSNPYDGNAVAISSDCSVQLGYASAGRAPLIGRQRGKARPPRPFGRLTKAARISRSGSEVVCLPCPIASRILQSDDLRVRCSLRHGPRTIRRRSILTRKGRSSWLNIRRREDEQSVQ